MRNSQEEQSDRDAVTRRAMQRIVKDRVRQKLPRHIKDPGTLAHIAFLIEGASVPEPKKKFRAPSAA